MKSNNYARSFIQLKEKAVKWWPLKFSKLEIETSVIPLLLESQDKFISVLNLAEINPFDIFKILEASSFPGSLFIKHLIVLCDVGAENLQRINTNFKSIINDRILKFYWQNKEYIYEFQELPVKGVLSNNRIGIDAKGLIYQKPLTSLQKDIAVILLFGANSVDEKPAELLRKCEIGGLLGTPKELTKFMKERYIIVSTITRGAQANALGQLAQTYVAGYLKDHLSNDFKIKRNGYIYIHEKSLNLPFDIVVNKNNKNIGIEISFQVTTNSVIERKAAQSRERYNLLHSQDDYIVYIIDGAGNIQRQSAVSLICANSDCTIAYDDKELDLLIEFIKEKLT